MSGPGLGIFWGDLGSFIVHSTESQTPGWCTELVFRGVGRVDKEVHAEDPVQPLRSGRLPGGGIGSAETLRKKGNSQKVLGMEARGKDLSARSLAESEGRGGGAGEVGSGWCGNHCHGH